MARVVHDSFRSEYSGATGARNSAERMNNLDFQECWDTRLQRTSIYLETGGFNEYPDGINSRSILLEVGGEETIAAAKGDPIMENDPLSELFPTLSDHIHLDLQGMSNITILHLETLEPIFWIL